jgi:nanoRNase/pAp phosphatase (c-di-AMP/oligoRNAs hydrolase)
MRCLAVCQDELVIRMLDEILMTDFEIQFVVESKALARRLNEGGASAIAGDPRRAEVFVKADLGPTTCVVIEDNNRKGLKKILEAARHAGLSMSELFGGPLLTEFGRSMTRARVQQYQRYFADADRVLILLHNDPDPDAIGSGLALRNILHRTKTTAILGAMQGVTRPENQRMLNLLDIQIEPVTPASLKEFDRVAMVDVQPHYFAGLVERVDLVVDHHPEHPGEEASVYKDVRPHYGSTSTILTEHLRSVDADISERTATAMLYAIKSDTLFFNRTTNRADIEAFSYLYPLADAALIRKMEGAEITAERLDYVMKAHTNGRLEGQVYCGFLGSTPREDFIPYVADFFLQLEHVKWTVIAGVVNDTLIVSVRNLGYTKNAGEFVRRFFADIGSAGGHRAMAKAVVPYRAFRDKFEITDATMIGSRLHEMVAQFLHDLPAKERRESVKSGA